MNPEPLAGVGLPARAPNLRPELVAIERTASRGVRYVGSDTTGIYCFPTCRHAKRITDPHRVEFRSEEAAEANGYRACKVCRPAA